MGMLRRYALRVKLKIVKIANLIPKDVLYAKITLFCIKINVSTNALQEWETLMEFAHSVPQIAISV